jgi:Domain of unknown function (DUF4263)
MDTDAPDQDPAMRLLDELRAPEDAGAPPMPWATYTAKAHAELDRLLNESPDREQVFQQFLERHPPFVPFAFPGNLGHGAYLEAMITQPPLKGLGTRVPDFLWIARHSGALMPVLVEIEAPSKKLVSGGKPKQHSAELSQALAQLREWREWLDIPANQQVFLDTYQIPLEWRSRRRFQPSYVLVMGRRDEDRDTIGKFRADLWPGQTLLTYDHLEPFEKQRNYITVRNDGAGGYGALHMPACADLEPNQAEWWRMIQGREQMVRASEWIDEERRSYLLDRIADWDAWAARIRGR